MPNTTKTPKAPINDDDLPENVKRLIDPERTTFHRDHYDREALQTIYAKLKQEGYSDEDIAKELSMTYPQVRELKRQVRGLLRRSTVRNWSAYISQEVERLEHLEEEALEAWALSKNNHIQDDAGNMVELVTSGNPKFLEIALKIIETRAKLFITMKKELPADDLENAAAILQIPEGANYAETLGALTKAIKARGN